MTHSSSQYPLATRPFSTPPRIHNDRKRDKMGEVVNAGTGIAIVIASSSPDDLPEGRED